MPTSFTILGVGLSATQFQGDPRLKIDTDAGADMSANAHEGANSNASGSDIAGNIDAKINKIISARLGRFEQTLSQKLEQVMGALQPKAVESPQHDQAQSMGDSAPSAERLSMKAMAEQLTQLRAQVQNAEKARKDAEQAALDARTRGEVHSHLVKALGPDSPHLRFVMDSLYDVRKVFGVENGQTVVKFQRDWGNEAVPLEQGIQELVNSELKAILPSKTATLPPTGPSAFMHARAQQGGAQAQAAPVSPIFGEIARSLQGTDPVAAAALLTPTNGARK